MPSHIQLLTTNWEFSQVASSPYSVQVKEEWLDCSIPTSVHVELKKRGKISDPFKGLAEWDVQCGYGILMEADTAGIQEAEWDFRTIFHVSPTQLVERCAELVFDGLDTYCDVILVSRRCRHS
jgi:beta-mannosidase